MPDSPETQYDLKLGLDTGPSAANARVLKSELVNIGSAADQTQAKIAATSQKGAASLSAAASSATAAKTSVSSLNDSVAKNTTNTNAASAAARAHATSTDRVAASSTSAANAHEKLAGSAAHAHRSMGKMLVTSAAVVLAFTAMHGVLSTLTSSLDEFRDFERTFAAIEIVAGTSATEIATLKNETRALGEGSIYTMTAIAQSEEALARSGLNAARITATLPAILDLATSANVDLAQATDVVVNVQHAFGISARESAKIADNLALAANRTATDVGSLGEGLKYVGPISRALGKDLSETSAGLGVLSNAGMQASMAGTGLRRVFSELAAPTDVAKKTLKELHLTIEQLNPETNSLASIVLKLAASGMDAGQAFKIFGDRGAPAIINLVNQAPRLVTLTGELRTVGNAASEMATRLIDTLYGSELALKSTAQSARISLGEVLSPAIREAQGEFQAFLVENRGEILDFGRSLASAASAGASAVLFLAENVDVLKAALVAWVSVRAISFVASLAAGLRETVLAAGAAAGATIAETTAATANAAALDGEAQAAAADALAHFELAQAKKASAIASAEAAAAEVVNVTSRGQSGTYGFLAADFAAQTAARDAAAKATRNVALAEAELALAGGRVKGIIDANTVAAERATKSAAFWSLGLTKTAVGLASFAAVLLYLNDKVVDFAETTQREMDAIVRSTNEFAQRLQDAKGNAADLLDQRRVEAEIEKSLLAAGVKAGTKEGDFLAAQVMNDIQRRRVDLLYEQRDALETATQAVATYSQKLDGLRDREQRELAVVQQLQQKRNAAPAGRGATGIISDLDARALDEAKAKLAATRGEIEGTSVALNRANAEQKTLTTTTKGLATATAGFKDETRLLSDEMGGMDSATEQQEKKFQKVSGSIVLQTSALRMLAKVYSLDESARADAMDSVEVENRLRQEAADLTAAQADALRPLIANLIAAQRTAEGAKTIDGLQVQLREINLLNAAYEQNVQAANEARRTLALEEQNRQSTAGAARDQRAQIEALNAEIAAGQKLQSEIQFTTGLEKQIENLQELEAAYYGGSEAIQAVTAAQARKLEYDRIIADLTPDQVAMFEELIQKYLDLGEAVDRASDLAGLRQQRSELERTLDIRRTSYLTTDSYEEAVRQLNIQLELERRILASKAPLDAAQVAAIRAEITALSDLEKQKRDQATYDQITTDFTGSLTTGIKSAINAGLVSLATGGKDVAKQIGDSLKKTFIQAAADYLTSMLSALAKELTIRIANAFKEAAARKALNAAGGGPMQSVGGAASGMSGLGGAGGAGGAWNFMSGGSALASVAWAAIAVAAVLAISNAVRKHADAVKYGTSVLVDSINDVNGAIGTSVRGGKQQTGGAIAEGIKGVLLALQEASGSLISELPRIELKIRNDGKLFSAWIGGHFLGQFKDATEAVKAAAIQAFQEASFSTTLAPELQQIIRGFQGNDPEKLIEALTTVRKILDEASGISDVEVRIRDLDGATSALSNQLINLGVDMNTARQVAEQWRVTELQNIRDQLTGHQASVEEQRAVFEQQRALFNARLTLEKLRVQQERDAAAADLAILEAGGTILSADVTAQSNYLQTKADLYGQSWSLDEANLRNMAAANGISIEIVRATLAALNEAYAALDQIKPIDASEFHPQGIGGGHGGNLGNVDTGPTEAEQRIEAFLQFLEDAELSGLTDYERALREINDQYDEQRATLEEMIAASDGSVESLATLAEQERQLAEWRRAEAARLREDIIDAFGSPMEEIRDRAQEVRDRVADWFASGQEIVDQFNAGEIDMSELMAALEEAQILWAEFGQAARTELLNLALYFADAMGDTEQSAAIREELAQLEWDLKRAEMALMLATYHELGLITDEAFAHWQTFVDNLPEDRPPAPEPPPPTTGSGEDTQAEKDRFLEELAAQIKEWRELGLGPAQRDARALRERYEELRDEAVRLNVATAELTAAYRFAADHMIDEILKPFEDLGLSDLEVELRDLRAEFLDYAAAFEEIGASADQMARLEEARIAALEDFWKRATEGLRDLLDEIRGEDPRRGPEDRFREAQAEFRDLARRAASGDLEALSQLEAAARDYRDATRGFLGEGVGAQAIGDEITSVLENLLANNPLLDGSSDQVAARIDRTNSILTAIADRLGAGIPVVTSDAAARQNGEAVARALGVSPLSPLDAGVLSAAPAASSATDERLVGALESIEALLAKKQAEEEKEKKARIQRALAGAGESSDSSDGELLAEAVRLLARIAGNTTKGPAGR